MDEVARYVGGSPETERPAFERLAKELLHVRLKVKRAAALERTFHAKAVLGMEKKAPAVPQRPARAHHP
ncbi:hypothetical protein ACFV2B_19525 [Streptomyces lavendulae]|uniref:hypothetical protein n=1 Tax=Streptomyces lavendulae TaxID=1914 RepID=UPI00367BC3AB